MGIVMSVAGLAIFGWGGLLLYYMASGRIPPRLRPLVRVWVRRDEPGDDGANVALWAIFSVLAGSVLTIVGISALIGH
jgi:hypothetical protein